MNRDPLYIGLSGFIGSGKDTVAKMLYAILNELDVSSGLTNLSKAEIYQKYKSTYSTEICPYATIDMSKNDLHCTCIAFADTLKEICSKIFGIPTSFFYYKKSSAWICMNKGFEYVEIQPDESHIVTAEELYYNYDFYNYSHEKYYMSLRDILIYIGTYVAQNHINYNIFVNSASNTIKRRLNTNKNINYVICTDVRFMHEYDFIKHNKGVMIRIVRPEVKQEENIAEKQLDSLEDNMYDYTIVNDGTYDDLFDKLWSLVFENAEFFNNSIMISNRVMNDIPLRYIKNEDHFDIYKVCTDAPIWMLKYDSEKLDEISAIDYIGGPYIAKDSKIEGHNFIVKKIKMINENVYVYIQENEP